MNNRIEILAGRDAESGNFIICNPVSKHTVLLPEMGKVDDSVQVCDAYSGSSHLRISTHSDEFRIEHCSFLWPIYVNGIEIISKSITNGDSITLGNNNFQLDLEILKIAIAKLHHNKLTAEQTYCFDISHLRGIWQSFREKRKKILNSQRRINLIRSGCGIFTMGSMFIARHNPALGSVMTGLGIVGNLYSFWGLKKENTFDDSEKLLEQFQETYICPNPDCNRFLGNISYSLIKRQYKMQCPYCKAQYREDIVSETSLGELKDSKHIWRWIMIATSSILFVIVGFLVANKLRHHLINHVENVTTHTPLGNAIYTGSVLPYDVNSDSPPVPDGIGTARIVSGEFNGCVYKGEFRKGEMDGKAIYTLKDGDVFNGEFRDNEYYRGRYTIQETGEYFEGTFRNKRPDIGNWHDPSHKIP